MSYPLFPQRRKLRKWIFALPRVRQQIDQRAIGNRLAPQIDKRAIDKGIARKSPLVSSVPLSLHIRLTSKAPYMHGKRKVATAGRVLLIYRNRGYALLAPVYDLSPLFPVALQRAHLQG